MPLPRRTPTVIEPNPGAEPPSMASFAQAHDRSEQVSNATETPLVQAVGDAYRNSRGDTLATLATGGIPKHFVEPLAHHLKTSETQGKVGGGFEIFSWLRTAARKRFANLVAEKAPKVDLQLELGKQRVAAPLGASAVQNATQPETPRLTLGELLAANKRVHAERKPPTFRGRAAVVDYLDPPTPITRRPANRTDATGPADAKPRRHRAPGLALGLSRRVRGKHQASPGRHRS